jgi:tryptophan halogenase
VVVAGGGIASRMAAVAIARRLPGVRVIRLDGLDGGDALEDWLGAARPSIRSFHHLLGIDEAEIVGRTQSAYRLGTSVRDWGDSPYFRGHGHYGNALPGVPFHQLWLHCARTTGAAAAVTSPAGTGAAAYDSFSVAAVLASKSRFALPASDPASPLAALDYGLQLYLPAYRQALQALGQAAGVQEIVARIRATELSPDGSTLTALELDDGQRLTADLFVDASGRRALVRSQLPFAWVDWSATLPVDRLMVASQPSDRVPPPNDELFAWSAGWRYEARTPGSTAHCLGYSSLHLNDTEAHRALGDATGCIAQDPPVVLRQGRLSEPWKGNCVAIGAAAVALEPAAATGLHLVCRHIERLIGCWPGYDCKPTAAERAFFNRRTAMEAERMRDFVQLPYLLSMRPEPFWRAAGAAPASAELTRDLALFRERGRSGVQDEDSFEPDEWLANLIGLGVRPRRIDTLAEETLPTRVDACLAESMTRLARAADTAPTHAQWLQRLRGNPR